MRAITYSKYGPPNVLRVAEVKTPTPGDDEVLIRVRAAEATKADCEMRSFKFSVNWFWLPLRIAVGILRPRRKILGGYFAGEVAAVGKNVDGFRIGAPVFGSAGMYMGAYGEYVALASTATLGAKPSNMTFAEAAAVPLGGLNALHFMRLARIAPGEKVLVIGAGGSIGLHAVQIAKDMGGEITAVDRAEKEALVRRFGADHFIDYKRDDLSGRTGQFDVVFDMVPSSAYKVCIAALMSGGRYLNGNPRLSVMLRTVLTNRYTDKSASFAFAKESTEELTALKEMIEGSKITSIVDRVLPMDRAEDAHRLVETEERLGAIVLQIGEPE